MLITDVKLVSDEAEDAHEGTQYTSVYHVYFSGGFAATDLIYNADGRLPKRGFNRSDNLSAFCDRVRCSVHPGDGAVASGVAVYTAHYSINHPTKNNAGNDPDPLGRRPEVRGGGVDIMEAVRFDTSGNPILNAAGDPYDSYPQRLIQAASFTIVRNEAGNPVAAALAFSNTLNTKATFGVAAKTLMLRQMEYEFMSEIYQGTRLDYWRVTYPIWYSPTGWNFMPLNIGWGAIDPTLGDYYQIVDKFGQRPTMPQPLTPDGYESEGDPQVFPTGGVQYITDADFSSLALPNPFANIP